MPDRQKAGIVEADIHGMNAYQAKVKIDTLLKQADKSVYRIRVVHGYHSGTILKDMVCKEYQKHPKVLRLDHAVNEGITDLILREI